MDSSWYPRRRASQNVFFTSSVGPAHLDYSESKEEKENSQGEEGMMDRVFIEKSLEKTEPLADKSESEASLRRRRRVELLTSAETCKNEMRSSQKRPTELPAASR